MRKCGTACGRPTEERVREVAGVLRPVAEARARYRRRSRARRSGRCSRASSRCAWRRRPRSGRRFAPVGGMRRMSWSTQKAPARDLDAGGRPLRERAGSDAKAAFRGRRRQGTSGGSGSHSLFGGLRWRVADHNVELRVSLGRVQASLCRSGADDFGATHLLRDGA